VPRFLRDPVYKLVARNRYRWFGRTEACRVPTPAIRARFLD
jgi:predicted DCC family thiol-disulfide oxidoreductase YuxK